MPSSAQTELIDRAAAALGQVAGAEVRPFSTMDFGREQNPKGRSVLVPVDAAEQLLDSVRKQLPPGTLAFVGLEEGPAGPHAELVVAEGSSQFDILRIAATDAINYGFSTEDLIRELQSWDAEYGIDIWQAATDTIQLRLRTLPTDLPAFAERVYKFCPDIVDQGVDDVRLLELAIAESHGLFLWWD